MSILEVGEKWREMLQERAFYYVPAGSSQVFLAELVLQTPHLSPDCRRKWPKSQEYTASYYGLVISTLIGILRV